MDWTWPRRLICEPRGSWGSYFLTRLRTELDTEPRSIPWTFMRTSHVGAMLKWVTLVGVMPRPRVARLPRSWVLSVVASPATGTMGVLATALTVSMRYCGVWTRIE